MLWIIINYKNDSSTRFRNFKGRIFSGAVLWVYSFKLVCIAAIHSSDRTCLLQYLQVHHKRKKVEDNSAPILLYYGFHFDHFTRDRRGVVRLNDSCIIIDRVLCHLILLVRGKDGRRLHFDLDYA